MGQRPANFDLGYVKAQARRRSKDKQLTAILMIALAHPDLKWAKHTVGGILLAGPHGTVSTHFTASDHRAHKNFESQLRLAGIYPSTRKA